MTNRQNPTPPILSRNLDDALTPGVVVEVDPQEAEALGAFEETALSEADAWEANADLSISTEEDSHNG